MGRLVLLMNRTSGGQASSHTCLTDRWDEAGLEALQSPLRTAEAFGVEEIIDPRQTRSYLCRFANLAAPLRQPGRPHFGYRSYERCRTLWV